jgi:hypothetical protein
MRRLQQLCGALVASLLGVIAVAQDDPEAKREPIPRGFRMYLVSDGRFSAEKTADGVFRDERNRIGKLHDPVTEYGLSSVVAVFARGVPANDIAPAVVLMKKQQEWAERYRAKRLSAFTAFLVLAKDFAADDDRDARIKDIEKFTKEANVPLVSVGIAEATVAAGEDAKEGAVKIAPQVAAWGIAAEDDITVIVYHRLKIVKRWKFAKDKPPTEADIAEIAGVVDEVMGKKKPAN